MQRKFNRNLWSSLELVSPFEFCVECLWIFKTYYCEDGLENIVDFVGLSIVLKINTLLRSMACMLFHHWGTCKPWSSLGSGNRARIVYHEVAFEAVIDTHFFFSTIYMCDCGLYRVRIISSAIKLQFKICKQKNLEKKKKEKQNNFQRRGRCQALLLW